MYDMCRFEKAWEVSKTSAWCAPFTKEELRVMEYMEDLYYYYAIGNGRKINAQLGCPVLQDMVNNFRLINNLLFFSCTFIFTATLQTLYFPAQIRFFFN